MKLTKRHINVLNYLSSQEGWTSRFRLPDGNGNCSGGRNASEATMSELKKYCFVEYGKDPKHSVYGYRITEAGRKALEDSDG